MKKSLERDELFPMAILHNGEVLLWQGNPSLVRYIFADFGIPVVVGVMMCIFMLLFGLLFMMHIVDEWEYVSSGEFINSWRASVGVAFHFIMIALTAIFLALIVRGLFVPTFRRCVDARHVMYAVSSQRAMIVQRRSTVESIYALSLGSWDMIDHGNGTGTILFLRQFGDRTFLSRIENPTQRIFIGIRDFLLVDHILTRLVRTGRDRSQEPNGVSLASELGTQAGAR